MSVVSIKELFRKNTYQIGSARQLVREWVCVLSDDALASPVSESAVFIAVGVDLGSHHPTYAEYACQKMTLTEGYEGSPYHVHLSAEYGPVLANEMLSPTSRIPVWEFDSSPGEVPALYYYDGDGNGTLRPLTNSAYDYFPGLTTNESFVNIKITQNFAILPSVWIAAQNYVNDSVYLGCPAHSIKVAKVNVAQSEEEAGGLIPYWKATAELVYRQSGHNLQLPDIGFNQISGGQKQRCMVFDLQNSEWIPSPNPVGLNGSGVQTNGAPAILNRRVNPVADFASLFGTPPTVPLVLY